MVHPKRHIIPLRSIYKNALVHWVYACKTVLLIIVSVHVISFGVAQPTTLEYTIKRKGDTVGNLLFTQSTSANRTTLRVESDVSTRFVISFLAEGQEESVFENDIMIRSSLYRLMNGKEKANKTTTLNGGHYLIRKGSKQEVLDIYPIRYNLLCMYTTEPLNISKVYSDNFQQFFDIYKMGNQHYKVNLPDRNFTEYFYQNGVCVKVHVHHKLYEATIELNRDDFSAKVLR